MTSSALPPAPRHLSAEARAWWRRFVEGWSLDDAGLFILSAALESFDRMRAAQRVLKREGLTVKGRGHPCTVVERDSRLAMLKALRNLNLDLEAIRPKRGRPPGPGH